MQRKHLFILKMKSFKHILMSRIFNSQAPFQLYQISHRPISVDWICENEPSFVLDITVPFWHFLQSYKNFFFGEINLFMFQFLFHAISFFNLFKMVVKLLQRVHIRNPPVAKS